MVLLRKLGPPPQRNDNALWLWVPAFAGRLVERVEPGHIGGVTPSRPTLTRAASSVPSSFLLAPKMMILAPAFSSDLSPATKATIGVSGGTTIFFSPSLYLTRMFCPSMPFTVSATVALVMVLPGRWSQGRKPSAAPRWVSGKM